jgi:hypothetical protein
MDPMNFVESPGSCAEGDWIKTLCDEHAIPGERDGRQTK